VPRKYHLLSIKIKLDKKATKYVCVFQFSLLIWRQSTINANCPANWPKFTLLWSVFV